MMRTPSLSVLMPAYNAARYVQEAIQSVLDQTFDDFEFLIIDDGSTDDTVHMINEYKDSRICLVRNPENLGLVKTLNKGLDLVKGQYVARMDADDICLPGRFASQVAFMDSHPGVGVCGTWIEVFGTHSYVHKYPSEPQAIKAGLFLGNQLAHPSVVMRRSLLAQHNLHYSEDWVHVEDYDLWQRASFCFDLANLPQVFLKYRMTEESICSKYGDKQGVAMLALDERNLRSLNVWDKLEHKDLIHSMRLAGFSSLKEFDSLISGDLEMILKANGVTGRYPEPWFTRLIQEETAKIRQTLTFREAVADGTEVQGGGEAAKGLQSSPVLRFVLDRIAPIGTNRREYIKKAAYIPYRCFLSCYRKLQRAADKM